LPDDPARWWLNGHRFMIGPLCIALAVPAYFALERWRSFVAPRALVMLSAISYNLYLWHLEIMVWVHNTGLPAVATIAIALPLALAVAAVLTYRFERPILNGHYRISIPTAALSAGLRLWKCTVPNVRYVASPDDPHVRRGVKPRASPAT
jgi:peptidoglycan/LPS O-acetylase OafA/YrhL